MQSAVPYYVPQEPGRWRAIALAVFVHALLFTFLWVGIRWQSDIPQTIEAEVWSPQPQEAAPPPPPPEPEPQPQEQPQPEVKAPPEQPDIALEQEKKKKLEEKKEAEKAEKLAQQKAELDKKKAEEKKHKDDEKKLAKLAELQRKAELKRITGEISSTGTSGAAPKNAGGPSNAWIGRVKAVVRGNTRLAFAVNDTGKPVEFDVRLLPDGSVVGVRMTQSSGMPEFDDAVKRGIEASSPFPRDSSGTVPTNQITIRYTLKELL